MTRYYSSWRLNPALIPPDPEERMKLWMRLLQKVKSELNSGDMKDWGMSVDLLSGYTIRETDEKGMAMDASGYTPFILAEIRLVLSADEAIEMMKSLAAATQTIGSR